MCTSFLNGQHSMSDQPALPRFHQASGRFTSFGNEMKHAAWSAPTWTALAVTADRSLTLKKIKGLLKDGL